MNSHPPSPAPDAAHLYLDFTGTLLPDWSKPVPPAIIDAWPGFVRIWLPDRHLSLIGNHFDAKN
jgi:hypothetical protein